MERPNVLWITLDSVRADHTTLAGYQRNTTPRLSDLAAGDGGFSTTNCISHGKSTLPSTGAIMSGLPPARNTVGVYGDRLPDEVQTVPERFAEAGYSTAGLSRNSFLSEETGLDRGFERFQWLASSTVHEAGVKTMLKYLLNIRKHSAGLTLNTAKHASPLLMNEVAKDWLSDFQREDAPFFFYLHYNEPHRPYYPPLSYLDRFTDDIEMGAKEAAETAYEIHVNLNKIIANGCNLSDPEWQALHAMYDAEIAYTDEMVGQLINYVNSLDIGETIVVVTADHGELFGEYGLLSHKYVLHDGVIRVPLAIDGLNIDLAVGENGLVQHNDVMRTLLELAEADTNGHTGRDLRTECPEFTVSQRGPPDLEKIKKYNPDFDTTPFFEGAVSALRTQEFKYVSNDNRSALYDLPDEDEDVSDSCSDIAENLSERLSAWLSKHGQPIGNVQQREYSEDVKQQLSELGYIE